MDKKIIAKSSVQGEHWVGDGFYVSTIFSVHPNNADLISPFLMMDHSAPREFKPASVARGVGEHPHRGFETVTFAYAGEIEHRDSGGGGGKIGPGDVQWMTAGSGVVHEEKHSQTFTKDGGTFEMVQLWVNLPAKDKMTKPRYQGLLDKSFPRVKSADGSSEARVVAGELKGQKGSALTFSPMSVFDVSFSKDGEFVSDIPQGWNTLLFLIHGEAQVGDDSLLKSRDFSVLDREGSVLRLKGKAGAKVLVLTGEPLNEPVVAYGPFVMNTVDQIRQAMDDYQSGRMGHLD